MPETWIYMKTSDQPDNLPRLLHMLLQLLIALIAPLGFFESLSSFQPVQYSLSNLSPWIIAYPFTLTRKSTIVATAKQDLWVAKTQREFRLKSLAPACVLKQTYSKAIHSPCDTRIFESFPRENWLEYTL
jgi:hypothetical protein